MISTMTCWFAREQVRAPIANLGMESLAQEPSAREAHQSAVYQWKNHFRLTIKNHQLQSIRLWRSRVVPMTQLKGLLSSCASDAKQRLRTPYMALDHQLSIRVAVQQVIQSAVFNKQLHSW